MTRTMTNLESSRSHHGVVADEDPAARPRRRSFTAEYKLWVLEEYDRLEPGAKGALLRREGPSSGDTNVSLTIGCLYPYGPGWPGNTADCVDGLIDEIAVYNRALTAEEISAQYAALKP